MIKLIIVLLKRAGGKMYELKEFGIVSMISGLIGLIVFACLGYFVYGGIGGAIAIVVVCFIYGLTTLLSFIPYAGFVVQFLTIHYLAWPWVSEFTNIGESWLTTAILCLTIISGFIYTIASTIAIRSG